MPSPYRSISTPLVKYINCEAEKNDDAITTVVLPEYIPRGVRHLDADRLAVFSLYFYELSPSGTRNP